MHALIGALIEDSSQQAALQRAKINVFQPLVWRGAFDYYTTFDEEDVSVSGRARYGDLPPVVPADSPEGQEWIEDRFETYSEEVEQYALKIDDYLRGLNGDYSALWESQSANRAKHLMHQLGRDEGYPVTLYDEASEGIRSREYLEQVQDAEDEVYVVLADVHW